MYCFIHITFDLTCCFVKFEKEFSILNTVDYNYICRDKTPIESLKTLKQFIIKELIDNIVIINSITYDQTWEIYKTLDIEKVKIDYQNLTQSEIDVAIQKIAIDSVKLKNDFIKRKIEKDIANITRKDLEDLPLLKTLVCSSYYSSTAWLRYC